MISELTVENLKSFAGASAVPLAPITILTGTNSSGKSSLLQAILLIKQGLESPARTAIGMFLNGRHASVGSYDDWSHNHENGSVRIGMLLTRNPRLNLDASRPLPRGRGDVRPAQWWLERAVGGASRLDEAVQGKLAFAFEFDAEQPNFAQLASVMWASSVTRNDTSYTYCMNAKGREGATETIFSLAVADPAGLEQYPFELTASGTTEAGDISIHSLCAVEGLLPVEALAATGEQAAVASIRGLLAGVVRATVARMTPGPRPQGALAKRLAGSEALKEFSPSRAVCKRYAGAIRKVSDEVLAQHFRDTAPPNIIANRLIARFRPFTPDLDVTDEMDELVFLIVDRFVRMMTSVWDVTRSVPPELATAAKILKEAQPKHSRFVDLALEFFIRTPGANEANAVQAGISRARDQAGASVESMAARPVGMLHRRFRGEEAEAPKEAAARRFFTDCVFHLGPLREEPRNLYTTDLPRTAEDVGKRGERAISCLRQFGDDLVYVPATESGRQPEYRRFLEGVTLWGKYLGLFSDLVVDDSSKYGTLCRVRGEHEDPRVRSDLTNVGVGVSQLLPVLVVCLAAPPGSSILIEQPELHLHPALQSRLAEFLAACALSGRQLIVETHSEHLVNRLRLLVAERRISADADLSVLFAERDEFGTSVRRVPVNSDGSIDDWPKGFFDESERLLAALMAARVGHHSGRRP